MGFLGMNALSLPAYALGGYIEAWRNVMMLTKVGHGLVVCTFTVCGSTTSTLSIGRKFELDRIPGFTLATPNFPHSTVNSSALWSVTPLRSLPSQTVGATSFGSSAASAGTILRF